MEGTVVFLVMSDDGDVINPNGTIAGKWDESNFYTKAEKSSKSYFFMLAVQCTNCAYC